MIGFPTRSQSSNAEAFRISSCSQQAEIFSEYTTQLSMSETKREKFTDASSSIRSAFGVHKTYVEENAPLNEKIVNAQFAQTPPKEVPASQSATVAATDAQTEEMQKALAAYSKD